MTASITRLGAIILTILILYTVVGCGGASQKEDAKDLLVKAQELQQAEKYEDAIRVYRKLNREYSDSREGINAQFMIGYIYANHVKDHEQAKIELNRFLKKYSTTADSGLIAGAEFELKYMGMDIEQIPILTDIGIVDSTVTEGETEGD